MSDLQDWRTGRGGGGGVAARAKDTVAARSARTHAISAAKQAEPGDPRARYRFDRALGENLRTAREARNVSKEALADALGVSARQIQHWEGGSRRVAAAQLMQIAFALAIPDEAIWTVLLPRVPKTKRLSGGVRPGGDTLTPCCSAAYADTDNDLISSCSKCGVEYA